DARTARLQRPRFRTPLWRSRIASTAGRPIASAHFNRTRRNVKKAKGSELPGGEIALTATGIPIRKRTATWLQILPPTKEKGQIEYDLTFLAKVLPVKNWMPAYLA